MKRLAPIAAAGLFLCLVSGAGARGKPAVKPEIVPTHLLCNWRARPLGVERQHPKLSWQLRASAKRSFGLRQTAYQVLVASTLAQLHMNDGNLWNTGKVLSARTIEIPYDGKPPHAFQRCWWKVRVWGGNGEVSAWSKPAMWSMGLKRRQWHANWISAPPTRNHGMIRQLLHHLSWVWLPGVGFNAPVGNVYFRKVIELPPGEIIKRADFYLTADNAFQLYINGQYAGAAHNWRRLHKISVNRFLHSGRDILAVKGVNGGSSPNPAGLLGVLIITFDHHSTEKIPVDTSWKISSRRKTGWRMPTFNDTPWRNAVNIAPWGQEPWGDIQLAPRPLPLLRRGFSITKRVSHAVICISGLGQYDLFINGRKVTRDLMQPAWTDYKKAVSYNTCDVTRYLHRGRNAIGVMLGTGMYDCPQGTHRYDHAPASFGRPKLICQLHIMFKDGGTTNIVSDRHWRTAPGPVTFSSIYGGEDYDALDATPGWDTAAFDDHHWQHVAVVHGPGGRLRSQIALPIRVMRIYKPVRVNHLNSSTTVYDLGQNMAGQFIIKATGPAGSKLVVYPSELLYPNGTEWQSCAGPIWCTYTLNGKGVDTFHPFFAYYGFRYLQVDAVAAGRSPDAKPQVLSVTGEATHTSSPTIGHFQCSNSLLNKIHHLITMAMVNNMESIITDCPTREKTGWLEDTHLVGAGIMDNYFVPRLYEQTAANMRDAQWSDGMVPDFAPQYFNYTGGFINSPEWGSACILDPWLTYKYFGDKQILTDNYAMMVRYLKYLKSRSVNGIIAFGLGDWYDLGPKPPGYEQLTTMGVTATATWYRDLKVMVKISHLLGHTSAARLYETQAHEVRSAFNRRFYHFAIGEYDGGSQCAQAMALVTGLVKKGDRPRVLSHLIENIRTHGYHTTAGDIGFHYVVEALMDAGQSELLYKMAVQTTPPSYGYQILHGATALTESWDALPADSQDHFMLGHIEQWFFQGLGGIRINMSRKVGRQVEIRPAIVGNLKWVKASYDSVLGKIICHWRREGNHLQLHVVIPPNVTARVYIPARNPAVVQLDGKLLSKTRLHLAHGRGAHPGKVICRVPSGHYHFTSIISP